jgi:hypothetical protein
MLLIQGHFGRPEIDPPCVVGYSLCCSTPQGPREGTGTGWTWAKEGMSLSTGDGLMLPWEPSQVYDKELANSQLAMMTSNKHLPHFTLLYKVGANSLS